MLVRTSSVVGSSSRQTTLPEMRNLALRCFGPCSRRFSSTWPETRGRSGSSSRPGDVMSGDRPNVVVLDPVEEKARWRSVSVREHRVRGTISGEPEEPGK
jgi:hypothetical protein